MLKFLKYKTPLIIIFGLLVFVGLVYFNYLIAQKAIRETKPAPLSIELSSFPEKIKVGTTANFIWDINSSPDLSTTFTTIYWGYESTPGALTKDDSPDAVRYPNFQPDYATGTFSLPDTFDENITFNQIARVYFRAYAKIRGEHLWSEEMHFDVEK